MAPARRTLSALLIRLCGRGAVFVSKMRLRTGKCFVNFQVQCKLQDDCNLFSLMGIITLTMNYEIGFLFFKYLFIYLAASRTGIKPTFPVLGGGFPTTGLPGKSLRLDVYV